MLPNVSRFARRTYRSLHKRVAGTPAMRERMSDLSADDLDILGQVAPYTMVAPERLYAYITAVRHVAQHDIPGAIVECGVWKGGASMAAMLALRSIECEDREFYLYDTYEGMSAPTEHDRCHDGRAAAQKFKLVRIDDTSSDWCRAEIDGVKQAILSTGYAANKIHFVKGKVEDTIPKTLPAQIAILRLDTDWYESTVHELRHLYPNLVAGGVLLIDDYGHWRGARKAVDEYLASNKICMLLHRDDYTGRSGIKI